MVETKWNLPAMTYRDAKPRNPSTGSTCGDPP